MKKIAIIKNILFILIGISALCDPFGVTDVTELTLLREELHLYLALILISIGGCGLWEAIKKK